MEKDKEVFVHIDSSEVRPEILDHQVENCPACNSELEFGFGLAGGGFGAYGFCVNCNKVVWKVECGDDF